VLRQELTAVGREMLWRRLGGEAVSFRPLETPGQACGGIKASPRQVVVGADGDLYPCAPMVGEDRDTGPEAALRIGHVRDEAASIRAAVSRDGAGCGDGRSCACAAYLETGSRAALGPNALWFQRLCMDIGQATAAGLAATQEKEAEEAAPAPPRKR